MNCEPQEYWVCDCGLHVDISDDQCDVCGVRRSCRGMAGPLIFSRAPFVTHHEPTPQEWERIQRERQRKAKHAAI